MLARFLHSLGASCVILGLVPRTQGATYADIGERRVGAGWTLRCGVAERWVLGPSPRMTSSVAAAGTIGPAADQVLDGRGCAADIAGAVSPGMRLMAVIVLPVLAMRGPASASGSTTTAM
jgi:hypothetical protein